jgi:hypothetical protein
MSILWYDVKSRDYIYLHVKQHYLMTCRLIIFI